MRMRKYQLTCEFVPTEEKAKEFCARMNKGASAYVRKKYPSHYTRWRGLDGTEDMFICYYYIG